jgi:cyclomaltodextrin glucanotransferase
VTSSISPYLAHYNDDQVTDPQYVNTGDNDPWNRPGMNSWDEDTQAFKIIRRLSRLRQPSPAIWKGRYVTAYVDNDILMFERIENGERVLVAINRGAEKTVSLRSSLGIAPGYCLLSNASEVNKDNYIAISPKGWTLHLNGLSSLIVHP